MSTSTTIAAPVGTWQLDRVHSSVAFQVPYLAGAFNGSFREFDGTLDLSDDGAALSGTVQVASVDVKDDNLNAHLQSPDFFDAENHPELSFTSDRIALDGESVRASGEITIKGVTRAIDATGAAHGPVANLSGNDSLRLQLTTTLDRNDFGVSWNAELPGGAKALGDEVTLLVELYFVKEA
jgi:polyisoprenoid-binding protein YceI